MKQLSVAVVGLGPIGVEIARAILERKSLRLVGAVDTDPALAGKPVATRVEGAPRALKIVPSLEKALAGKSRPDAIALATSSRFRAVTGDLQTCVKRKVHVVSTCEELAAPLVDARGWKKLDDAARRAKVTLLGTGVNPGFVMDRLVLQLAGACVSVAKVEVERVVDAAKRRAPLRKKVGEGLTIDEFRRGVADGRIGHVGLRESVALIARGLGWKLDKIVDEIIPEPDGDDFRCRGLRQRAVGIVGGEERITLRLSMYVGAPDPHDRIWIAADPPLDVIIAGGTQGDRGTIGTVVNALERLPRAPRGLVTVADVFA